MFIYDKDMERVMLAKKKEVLSEIEAAKARVLKELYCVKRGVHTDMCEMLADYNRIDFMLKKTVSDCKKQIEDTVKEFQVIIADTFNEYNAEIDLRISHLENLEAQVTTELNAKLAEFENMETRVSDAIEQLETLIADGVVSQDDFDNFKTEVAGMLENAGAVSDWNEADETSKAFIKNKPFSMTYDKNSGEGMALRFNPDSDEDIGGGFFRTVWYDTFKFEKVNKYFTVELQINYGVQDAIFLGGFFPVTTETGLTLCDYKDEHLEIKLYWLKDTKKLIAEYKKTGYEKYTNISFLKYTISRKTIDSEYLAPVNTGCEFLQHVNGVNVWTSAPTLVSPSGSKFMLTVSDDGTLSATAVTE